MGTWSRFRSASAFTWLRRASPRTRRCARPTGPCTRPNGAPGSLLSVPEPLLSTADWFASLSTVYLSASMLITDKDDRILLVKPNYRPDWGIPGGIVEADEAPDQCATREIAEELGLDIPAGDLLVVDWGAAAGGRTRGTARRRSSPSFSPGVCAAPPVPSGCRRRNWTTPSSSTGPRPRPGWREAWRPGCPPPVRPGRAAAPCP